MHINEDYLDKVISSDDFESGDEVSLDYELAIYYRFELKLLHSPMI